MLLNRKISCLAVGLLVLLSGTSAIGQGLQGMQLFAPADVSSIGRGPQPNEGFFFVFDGLYWTISVPKVVPIGNAAVPTRKVYRIMPAGADPEDYSFIQHNTLDTGQFQTDWTAGNRIEVGRVEGNHGWMVSGYQLRDLGQSFISNNIDVNFADPTFGVNASQLLNGDVGGTNPDPPPDTLILPLPVTFTAVLVQSVVTTWGIEFDYIGRSNQLHNGSFFEWYLGPRYIEFDDNYLVLANGGILDQSFWNTEAENHIIAGQIGGRMFKKLGRWMLSSEGRFLAGLNCQNIHQYGRIGSNLVPPGGQGAPLLLGPTSFNHNEFIREFTPGIEVRLDARYQITRSVSFRAGWTGLWLDNVARSSNMVDYTLNGVTGNIMGILRNQNKDNVLLNGLTIGIDINR
jgi:hypothetical protein